MNIGIVLNRYRPIHLVKYSILLFHPKKLDITRYYSSPLLKTQHKKSRKTNLWRNKSKNKLIKLDVRWKHFEMVIKEFENKHQVLEKFGEKMSYVLTTLTKKEEIDSLIKNTIDKLLVLRFGKSSDFVCLQLDDIVIIHSLLITQIIQFLSI